MLPFLKKEPFLIIVFTVLLLNGSTAFGQKITAEQNYAMNSPGVVMLQTIFSATVYVNKVKMNERAFNRLVDSVRRLDTTRTILSPEQKLDMVIKALYSNPLRFFSGTDEYLMQEHRITSTGTGFFITSNGYLITNCHVIDRDSAFIRSKFILSTYQEVTDANIKALQSSWGMTFTEEQKNLLYNTYGFVYSQVSSMILFDLKKEINILYRVDGENGKTIQVTKQAQVISKGQPMPGKDVALLKIEDGHDLPSLSISKDSIPKVGGQILVFGYPEPVTGNSFLATEAGIEPTLTSGIISAIKKSVGGWPVIQMDAMISHGSSGSPVCDEKGEVIGLTTFGSLEQGTGELASGFNFAIPVSVIKEFLAAAHLHPEPAKASILFNAGLDFFYNADYSKALNKFEEVKKINSSYPQLNYYILQCRSKIAEGREKQSHSLEYNFWIVAAIILLAGGYILYIRQKRRSV
ncbi:MAG: S1C family serine protease [Chitinophagales bacterium]